MKIKKIFLTKSTVFASVGVLFFAAIAPVLSVYRASAAPLTNRSLMVTSTVASDDALAPDGTTYTGLTPGDPRNGAQVGHTYTFTTGSSSTVKAFTFEYCTSAFGYIGAGACAGAPAGFSASSWASGTAVVTVGGTPENWNVAAAGTNMLTISNAGSTLINNSGLEVEIKFTPNSSNYFVNPNTTYKNSGTNGTYFAHIVSHNNATVNEGTTDIDDGTVTNNVANAIGIYTRVQETLNFSVEGENSEGDVTPGPTPQGSTCAPLVESGQIKMGDPNHALSTQQAYKAKSYFRISTNSANGTRVLYAGNTLANSNHDIAAIGTTRAASNPGTEQFGIAFDLTDAAANVGVSSQLTPLLDYNNNANGYAFNGTNPADTKLLAQSPAGLACETGAVEYVANISPDTPAGIYQTKINYIATPAY